MIRFESDYTEGCHPAILEALTQTNMEQHPGYGQDEHCERAREMIRKELKAPDADVHFLVGGTQANATVICAALRPYQGVLCAETGHINCHETGAIEALGHKVLPLPSEDGLISAKQVDAYCDAHFSDSGSEHTVQPAMVYISQPTETGLLYSLDQLFELHRVCQRYGLILFMDGARCGYGLAAPSNTVSLTDMVTLCDVFTIGGTKVGALFGEAVIITNPSLKKDFRYVIKRQGGMLAKGRLLGIQFEALMQDGLYQKLGQHAVSLAQQIRQAFLDCGVSFRFEPVTNQLFPILTAAEQQAFAQKYTFSQWDDLISDPGAVRFCTSWCTSEEAVNTLTHDIHRICVR